MGTIFRLKRRILCAYLALCAAFAVIPTGAFADAGIYKGTIAPAEPFADHGIAPDYYYSDDYFSLSGKSDNPHLRTLSFILALTACDPSCAILDEIGFNNDKMTYDLDSVPTQDSIGTLITHKNIGGREVILTVIRGYNYKKEWISNFNTGAQGDHAGFSQAAGKVIERIKSYEDSLGLNGAKIWITGYSRAGAVCDLAGRSINGSLEEFAISDNDLYAYTFEAPHSSAQETRYENIHNIISENDLITYLPPAAWQIHSCGTVTVLDDGGKMIMTKTVSLGSSISLTDNGEISQKEFLAELNDWIGGKLDRKTYDEILSSHIGDLMSVYFSKSSDERAKILDYLKVSLTSALSNSLDSIFLTLFLSGGSDSAYRSVADTLISYLDAGRQQLDPPLTDEEYTYLTESIFPIAKTLIPVVLADYSYTRNQIQLPLYHFATLLGNIDPLVCDHLAGAVLSSLQELDEYYTVSTAGIFSDVTENDWFFDAVNYMYSSGYMSGAGDNKFLPFADLTRGMTVAVVMRIAGAQAPSTASPFEDIAGDEYYAGAAAWAKSAGIASGVDETHFAPADAVTREQLAVMIMNYLKSQGLDAAPQSTDIILAKFSDNADISDYARESIAEAISLGFISGRSETELFPKATVTRAEACSMFQRASDLAALTD